jgi:transposase
MAGVRVDELAGRLSTIPGVEQRAAETVIAEIGPDMKQFATAEHLASWAARFDKLLLYFFAR